MNEPKRPENKKKPILKFLPFVAALILIAAAGGAVFLVKSRQKPAQPEPVQVHEKVKGPENAPVTLVEYSDFQCPACAFAQPVLNELFVKYPGQIRIVYRHFPLQGHLWAMLAHQAAECALRQGKFWEYHDQLYGSQKEWAAPANPSEKFLKKAQILGLNVELFAGCLSDETVSAELLKEKKRGDELRVESTPTFFINGERVVGPNEIKMRGEGLIRKILNLPELAPAAPAPPVTAPANP